MDIAAALHDAMEDLRKLDRRGLGEAFTIEALRERFRGGIEARVALSNRVAESVAGVLSRHVLSTATRVVAADRLIAELDEIGKAHAQRAERNADDVAKLTGHLSEKKKEMEEKRATLEEKDQAIREKSTAIAIGRIKHAAVKSSGASTAKQLKERLEETEGKLGQVVAEVSCKDVGGAQRGREVDGR